MSLYKKLLKPLFFILNAEIAHYTAMNLLQWVCKFPGGGLLMRTLYTIKHPSLQRTVLGMHFDNPVGLAAGFDKNGAYIDPLTNLGFGFIEVGTVTPLAQSGNEKPRLFRLIKDEAIINRMGFNNDGLEKLIERLKKRNTKIIVGGNIGKNKVTSNELALYDYDKCFTALYPYVDYFVVNVSSPNTPNLRELQDKEPLTKLLKHLDVANTQISKAQNKPKKPILLKIAPDLTTGQLDEIIDIVVQTHTSGIVATNTTVTRHQLQTSNVELDKIGAGGLSGKPLKTRSTEVIRYIHQRTNGTLPIIGVGGIYTADDALEKLHAGASLVQVYSGFVYEGPGIVKQILQKMV